MRCGGNYMEATMPCGKKKKVKKPKKIKKIKKSKK